MNRTKRPTNKLRSQRERAGVDKQLMAVLAGVDRKTIENWESKGAPNAIVEFAYERIDEFKTSRLQKLGSTCNQLTLFGGSERMAETCEPDVLRHMGDRQASVDILAA